MKTASRVVAALLLLIFIVVLVAAGYWLQEKSKAAEKASPVVLASTATVPQVPIISDAATLTADFSYLGKPINPRCIDDIVEGSDDGSLATIDLAQCSSIEKGASYDDKSIPLTYTNPPVDGQDGGYVEYEPIFQKGNVFGLNVTDQGGGSGIFTSVVLVQKEGTILTFQKNIAGGDRCNGGITDASYGNNILDYTVSMTPIDMVTLGDPKTTLQAYSDLEDSAMSCFGEGEYAYNINTGEQAIKDVILGDGDTQNTDVEDQPGWTENYKYQSCFNKVYNTYLHNSFNGTLDQEGITEFTTDFMNKCSVPKSEQ